MKNKYSIDIASLQAIIEQGFETPLIEFKTLLEIQNPEDPDKEKELKAEFIRDIISLSNMSLLLQRNSYLIIGVSDKGEPLGMDEHLDDSVYQNIVNSLVNPPIDFLYQVREIKNTKLGIFVICPSGSIVHTVSKDFNSSKKRKLLLKGETWIRAGTSKKKLSEPTDVLNLQHKLGEIINTKTQSRIFKKPTQKPKIHNRNLIVRWVSLADNIFNPVELEKLEIKKTDRTDVEHGDSYSLAKLLYQNAPKVSLEIENMSAFTLRKMKLFLEFPSEIFVFDKNFTFNPLARKIEKEEPITFQSLFGGILKQSFTDAKEEASGVSLYFNDEHSLSLLFEEIEHRDMLYYPGIIIIGGFDKGEYDVKWNLIYDGSQQSISDNLHLSIVD